MAEKLMTAKELAAAFDQIGVRQSYRFFRFMIIDCPDSLGRRFLAFSKAMEWWQANPDWKPNTDKNMQRRATIGIG